MALIQWREFADVLACPDDGGSLELRDEHLSCMVCNRRFNVEDGIISMLPKRLQAPRDDSDQQKLREQRTRDEQAEWYDRLFGLKVVGILEVPTYMKLLGDAKYSLALEVGCGTGRITERILPSAHQLIALDLSRTSLLHCRQRVASVSEEHCICLVHGDANALPVKDKAFDLIFSAQALEHIPSKELQINAFARIARALKPGAPFIFSIYHWSWLMRIFGRKEGYHPGNIYFYRWTPDELRTALEAHFTVEYMRPCAGYILIVKALRK
ncbi:MAG TPA: methyltransferase domain-containing protein [Armatimonadetes bacterium]|nr:methyltransferase domain-containing protein [Armatimonadota bacterium]